MNKTTYWYTLNDENGNIMGKVAIVFDRFLDNDELEMLNKSSCVHISKKDFEQ